ncbi:MAG: hypothetical protein ThorAB25_23330 [Candidatus Thorarchaeota archaeon AB_25]|nr:MAG: hypothetical protein ThorAB25_23330 [Candidatus Thorarchaeota archaeon AB_25]
MQEKGRVILENQDQIEVWFNKKVDSTWKRFKRRYGNVKEKITFTLFMMLNDASMKMGTPEQLDTEQLRRLRICIFTLDEVISRGWDRVIELSDDDEEYIERSEVFLEIGRLKERLWALKAFGVKEASWKTDQPPYLDEIEAEPAFLEWRENLTFDEEWIEFLPQMRKEIGEKTSKQVERELFGRYGVSRGFLLLFQHKVGELLVNKLKSSPSGFIGFPKETLIAIMLEDMPSELRIDEEVARRFLHELEYHPERDWCRSPFLRVRHRSQELYVPIPAVFYPYKQFFNAWAMHIIRDFRESSASGRIGKAWGDLFERYVRQKLESLNLLQTIQRNVKVRPGDFPDIKESLDFIGKPEIEIDVIAKSPQRLYVISCKARDFHDSTKLLHDFSIGEYSEFEKNLRQDIKDATEIRDYSRCLEQSSLFLNAIGFEGDEVKPLLVTPDTRPMSLEIVRNWAKDLEYGVPVVDVIQAMNLEKYILST